jgi:hypothetical protein
VSVRKGCRTKRIRWISLMLCHKLHKTSNLLSLYSFWKGIQSLSMNMYSKLRLWWSTPLTTIATSLTTSKACRCHQEISFW